jgi:anti-anti-sigma regulatory factor
MTGLQSRCSWTVVGLQAPVVLTSGLFTLLGSCGFRVLVKQMSTARKNRGTPILLVVVVILTLATILDSGSC